MWADDRAVYYATADGCVLLTEDRALIEFCANDRFA